MKCRMPFTAWWSLLTTRAKSLRYMLPWGRGPGIGGRGRDRKRRGGGRKLGWASLGQKVGGVKTANLASLPARKTGAKGHAQTS